ncbi:MAG TPA: hypothetical protein VFN29_09025 [Chiayiivirga sp.]|nr:hypothetical protein [Chiayiivirga sp.]
MRKVWIVVAVLVLGGLLWFGLGRKAEVAIAHDDPLAFVPDDTPYVFANVESIPTDVVVRYMKQSDAQFGQWRQQLQKLETSLEAALDEAATSDAGTDNAVDEGDSDGDTSNVAHDESSPSDKSEARQRRALAWLRAFSAELEPVHTVKDLMQRMGMDMSVKVAFYGVGVVPVWRTSLADPAAFKAFVERLQKTAGESFPTLQLDGIEAGWRVAIDDVPIHLVVAIVGKHMVVTIAPAEGSDGLRQLLGLDRPAKSLASSGGLQSFNRSEGFLPYGSGYLDTARVVAQFRLPATPLEAAFLKVFGVSKPMLPAECEADATRLVSAMPRWSAGYLRLDVDGAETLARIETSPPIAQALMKLRAPVPGLASAAQSLGSFGSALKVSELPGLGNALGSTLSAEPLTCPALDGVNDVVAAIRTQLNNPALFAAGPVYNSLMVAVDQFSFDMDTKKFDELVGRVVIGSDNPASLIATASSFVPQLASLKLSPDAAPQSVPAELLGGTIEQPVFVAMTKGAIGLGIGAGEEKRLPSHLEAGSAQPLLHLRYRGALMVKFAKMMEDQAQDLPEPERSEMIDSAKMLADVYGTYIDALEMSIEFAPKGIELRQKVDLLQ